MVWRRIGVSAAAALLLAGCASQDAGAPSAGPEPPAVSTPASPTPSATPDALAIEAVALSEAVSHVHGLVATDAGTVVAGTHRGARTVTAAGAVSAPGGAQDDLMGMTGEAGTQRLASSGHPGPGTSLPNPLGLITSTDGGATWTPVSLQGRERHAPTPSILRRATIRSTPLAQMQMVYRRCSQA